jgi:hypothetical protein
MLEELALKGKTDSKHRNLNNSNTYNKLTNQLL